MSTRVSQPAENFDSTAKLMLEALGKASAELEKSVTAFTEQLISFNEGLQKTLDEEMRSVNVRMENSIKSNLDELGHSKHLLVKRVLEAERTELDSLAQAGRDTRALLSAHALKIEQKIEEFINVQISELKEFLEEPKRSIHGVTDSANDELREKQQAISGDIKDTNESLRKRLSDKVAELENLIRQETQSARDAIAYSAEESKDKLSSIADVNFGDLTKFFDDTIRDVDARDEQGGTALEEAESQSRAAVKDVGHDWKTQISSHCETFDKLLASLSSVLKENYETKLANASEQARQEIAQLSDTAHEKIAATHTELEVELRDLEKDYIQQFENALQKVESIVSEHANDKRNSGVARQHKAQKLRDQMHGHLKRFGSSLVDSVKDASGEFESEFNRATDGFHTRIEGARVSAIESLERESRLMQKDIERTMKEFQKELAELDSQVGLIEKAGQDAALTVIACRKAVLSFRGE
jgi:hypothetical protein